MKLLLLAVLVVICVSSSAAPIEDELAFEQYQDVDGNKNFAAVEQGLLDILTGSLKDSVREFCDRLQKMPQETERVFIQSIDSKFQMMQNEEDSEDIAAMQFFETVRKQWLNNAGNWFQEISKKACNKYIESPTSFEDVLVQRLFDSNTNEVTSQGRRRGFFRRLKNTAKGIARKTFCSSLKDTQAQEEALVQYIDNQLEMMQDGEGEAQIWKGIRKFWKKNKRFLKPIIKRNFCANIEVMDDDDEIEDMIVQSVLQSFPEVDQKK